MKIVIQRVSRASVSVNGEVVASIAHGALVLVGIAQSDARAQADLLANKLATLRMFPAPDGSSGFDRSLLDVGGAALMVSQFTLYGEARKGRRPDFLAAAKPDAAAPLFDYLCERVVAAGVVVSRGVFGAHMLVELVNDGPVTLIVEAPLSARPV